MLSFPPVAHFGLLTCCCLLSNPTRRLNPVGCTSQCICHVNHLFYTPPTPHRRSRGPKKHPPRAPPHWEGLPWGRLYPNEPLDLVVAAKLAHHKPLCAREGWTAHVCAPDVFGFLHPETILLAKHDVRDAADLGEDSPAELVGLDDNSGELDVEGQPGVVAMDGLEGNTAVTAAGLSPPGVFVHVPVVWLKLHLKH